MSDNNDFLNNYGKGGSAKKEIVVREASLPSFKYEQKSEFKPPESRGEMPPVSPGRKKLIIGIAAGAAALVVVVLLLVILLNRGVAMIDLVGRTQSEAQLWAKDKGVTLQVAEEYNDAYDAGVIFAQDVEPGTRVKKDTFIRVSVSKGHDPAFTLTLPDMMSMTMAQVQKWAADNYMTKVRVTTAFSNTVPLDHVISYTVNDDTVTGDTVRRDSPIYVVVSKGPEDEAALQVTVPDFKTMSLNECQTFARENGLVLIIDEQYDDYAPSGSVISQSVKAQEKVTRGSEITLVVSLGKKIIVPDFSVYSSEAAAATASHLGISATLIEVYSSSSAGAFISQSIGAGTVYTSGEILELTYSLGNKIVVPSFVGQTRDAIEAWALALNEKGASIAISATPTNSSAPAGTIIYQSPANTSVGVKKTISITVSRGSILYVPDFVDETGSNYNTAILREDAIKMCDEVGLIPVFVEAAPTIGGTWLPGEIWYQDISAGTEKTQGAKITLKYVASKPIDAPGVPNFYGMTQGAATAYANKLRIVFVEGDTYFGDGSDVVIAQSITAGTTVAMGTEITLTLGQLSP
jgi:beta-lactam-binding protein with PASTA domain